MNPTSYEDLESSLSGAMGTKKALSICRQVSEQSPTTFSNLLGSLLTLMQTTVDWENPKSLWLVPYEGMTSPAWQPPEGFELNPTPRVELALDADATAMNANWAAHDVAGYLLFTASDMYNLASECPALASALTPHLGTLGNAVRQEAVSNAFKAILAGQWYQHNKRRWVKELHQTRR